MLNTLNYNSTDTGNCRVYVKNKRSLYCFQEEAAGSTPLLYLCTKEGEPEYIVSIPTETKLNLLSGGYLFDEITTAFKRGDYFIKPTIPPHKRAYLESDFVYVNAEIIWIGQSQPVETVKIANSSDYLDLETCNFCGKCKNCKQDESIHYYANNLTELDQLMENAHDDGWMIQSYSIIDDEKN